MNHLNTTWLWDKLRVEGGAYGASCHCDTHSGDFAFVSYRDPNLQATLDIYDKSAEFLRAAPVGEADLKHHRGDRRHGYLPDARRQGLDLDGELADRRHRRAHQRGREEILSASPADFRTLADALAEFARHGNVVVLGSEQAIAEANARREDVLQRS
jgi:Zn-dependent M16 (insulinase) family peptidase